MKELSTEEKAYDGNYKTYTELINRLEDVKDAIKKQNYGIAMDILCKPYPQFQVITHSELEESEDEKIIKAIKSAVLQLTDIYLQEKYGLKQSDCIAWLEKQGETFTKKDVDDAYLKGICDAKHELEKQDGLIGDTDTVDSNEDGLIAETIRYKKEQKPADKVEPKFHEGDWITIKE